MPVVTLIEPFTESIVCGLVGAWGFQDLIDWRVFLTAHFAMWLLADFLIIRGLPYAFQWSQAGELFVIWLMRELSAIPIYIWTVLFDSNRVVWRGRTYKLLMGGTVIEQDNDVNNSSKLFSGVGLLGRFPVDLMLFVVSLLLRPIFMFTSTPKQNLSNTSDRMIVDQQDCVYETAEYSE